MQASLGHYYYVGYYRLKSRKKTILSRCPHEHRTQDEANTCRLQNYYTAGWVRRRCVAAIVFQGKFTAFIDHAFIEPAVPRNKRNLVWILSQMKPTYRAQFRKMSTAQRRVFKAMARIEYPAAVKDIAHRAKIDSPSCSRRLARIRTFGYVINIDGKWEIIDKWFMQWSRMMNGEIVNFPQSMPPLIPNTNPVLPDKVIQYDKNGYKRIEPNMGAGQNEIWRSYNLRSKRSN